MYARGVGGGTLLVAAIAMTSGVNLWNLGRIVAPGLGLIFTAASVALLDRDARPPRLVDVLRGHRVHSWTAAAVTVLRTAYAVLAAIWLALGLLNYAGVLRADPALSVLRWPAMPLAAFVAAHTAFPARASGFVGWARWSSSLRAAHLLARAVMAGGGLLIVAAPFELVGAEVRRFLVPAFIAATALHLLLATRHLAGRPLGPGAGAAARMAIHGRYVGLAWPSAGLAVLGAVLAGVLPGWSGAIAGALTGQLALLAYLIDYAACDPWCRAPVARDTGPLTGGRDAWSGG